MQVHIADRIVAHSPARQSYRSERHTLIFQLNHAVPVYPHIPVIQHPFPIAVITGECRRVDCIYTKLWQDCVHMILPFLVQ